ncbi:chemotaxis protein CheD [Halobacteria archaeon AArc-dxtr1]|nr:chemotaxis protein CheD [Halobacteria archaeon AArc-dxtr1]
MTGEQVTDPGPIPVGVAEYAVAVGERPLRTTGVGSCGVVVVHDETSLVSGLLHFMLPEADARTDDDAKFADTGIAALLSTFEANGGDLATAWAKLTGGATMVQFESFDTPIGEQNIGAAEEVLSDRNLPLRGADTGGDAGRKVTFYPSSGELRIKRATGTVRRI